MFASFLGPQEIVILLVLGVLLFGRKLPEVGRSLGKSIVEFKKGLGGYEEDDGQGLGVPRGPNPPPRITNTSVQASDPLANREGSAPETA